MAHMIPVAEHFAAYHVETNAGVEIVPEEICGKLDPGDGDDAMLTPYESLANQHALEPYLEGSRIEGVDRKEGWYGRLSAPGYLDATDWMGSYESSRAALDAVCEQYDVDDEGNEINIDAPHGLCEECGRALDETKSCASCGTDDRGETSP